MTTASLSTRMIVPHYGNTPLDVIAEYTYYPRDRAIEVHAIVIEVDGAEISIAHHLTLDQRTQITEECREDYLLRMESAVEERRRNREYDAWT